MRLKSFNLKKIFFIVFFAISCIGTAQTKRIKILQADNTFTDPKYPGATVSLGNVFVEHDGATLRCNKAYIYQDTKIIKALGNVILNQGDTIIQYSKYVDYDGAKKLATSWGDVILKDPMMTLTTDTLKFDREKQLLHYDNNAKIKDTTNELRSKIGNYYLETKKFQAFKNVEIENKESKVVTEHLDYNTYTGIADLTGPSTITNNKNSIYTENGHHNTKSNISHFLKNSKIFYSDRTIEGDSLYYNKNKDFASATKNIKVIDTANQTIIKGDYAEFFKLKDSVFITKKAVAISIIQKDSLYIHGDTLRVTGKVDARIIKAFHHVKFYKSDMQGKCDSLVTNEKTGFTKLFSKPVLWAQGSQITGDIIHFKSNIKTEQLDSLFIYENALMVKKDSAGFSQMKGKNMYGKFENNDLKTLDVVGNSETIVFLRDELDQLVGIDKKRSSKNIFITLENKEINSIEYYNMIEGFTYPPSKFEKLKDTDKLLKGFIWRESERPKKMEDIFVRDSIAVEGKSDKGKQIKPDADAAVIPTAVSTETKPVKTNLKPNSPTKSEK